MNVYRTETGIIFTEDIHADRDLLASGEFSEKEIKYGKDFRNGKIIIDSEKFSTDELIKENEEASVRRTEIIQNRIMALAVKSLIEDGTFDKNGNLK